MGKKRTRIYEAILTGATDGLSGTALYDFTVERCPKAASGKIVRAAMLALSDPKLTDSNILQTISSFAVEQRIKELGVKAKASPRGKLRKNRRDHKPNTIVSHAAI
jgi:hypothetical protein